MKEQSYNRQLELYIYKKLEDYGIEECKGIVKLFNEHGRLYTYPKAYGYYAAVLKVIRTRFKIEKGYLKATNKLYTQEEFDLLKSYVDKMFEEV